MADGYIMTDEAGAAAGEVAGPVEAALNYQAPTAEKPHTYNYEPPPGVARQNFSDDAKSVLIEDMRGQEHTFSLDQHGFAGLFRASRIKAFDDEATIRSQYYPECEALLARELGADRALIFDHTIRRRVPGQPDHQEGSRQPVARVHVDQTELSGPERVQRHLPAEADALLRGRVRIVNLWRPIRGPVLDRPLAMADGGSIGPDDLVATDLLYPDRAGEIYSVLHSSAHRWYYWSMMQPDEVLLLKCYDSARDVRSRLSPHSAFIDPRVDEHAPPRQSIELRALVFGG